SLVVAPGHAPLPMVQRYTLSPRPMPVTVVVGLFASPKVPVPLTSVQVPIAGGTAAFAVSATLANGAQNSWSGPALATAAFRSKTRIVTSSDVVGGTQGPLLMVQRSTCVPGGIPVTVLTGLPGV